MKNKNLLLLLITVISLMSCTSQMVSVSDGKQIDRRLVGLWTGSEKDQQIEGVTKSWEMDRRIDGTFELDFQYTMNGDTQFSTETGNWWVEDGKFYEKHNESGNTDVYSYTVLNKNQVKFSSEDISTEMNTDSYEFIDTRKASTKNSNTDGSSIANAIKVKSVPEEYEYVKKNCSGCKMVSQSLIQEKGKPYDLLQLVKPDGTEVNYYFDISSFFGKW